MKICSDVFSNRPVIAVPTRIVELILNGHRAG